MNLEFGGHRVRCQHLESRFDENPDPPRAGGRTSRRPRAGEAIGERPAQFDYRPAGVLLRLTGQRDRRPSTRRRDCGRAASTLAMPWFDLVQLFG